MSDTVLSSYPKLSVFQIIIVDVPRLDNVENIVIWRPENLGDLIKKVLNRFVKIFADIEGLIDEYWLLKATEEYVLKV